MTDTPWTDEQVAALNATQQCGWLHPFTCGSGNRMDAPHRIAQMLVGGDHGQLVATREGWFCLACDYRQDWAHAFMFEPQVNPMLAWFNDPANTQAPSGEARGDL